MVLPVTGSTVDEPMFLMAVTLISYQLLRNTP